MGVLAPDFGTKGELLQEIVAVLQMGLGVRGDGLAEDQLPTFVVGEEVRV